MLGMAFQFKRAARYWMNSDAGLCPTPGFLSVVIWAAFSIAFLISSSVALGEQDNPVARASELMRAGNFHDAELLWRELENLILMTRSFTEI